MMIIDQPARRSSTSAALSLVDYLRKQPDVAAAQQRVHRSGRRRDARVSSQEWPPTTFVPRTAYTDEALRARLGELREQAREPGGRAAFGRAHRAIRSAACGNHSKRMRVSAGRAVVDDDGVLMSARSQARIRVRGDSVVAVRHRAQRQFRAKLDAG